MEEMQHALGLCLGSPPNVPITLDFRADTRHKSQPTMSIDLRTNSETRLNLKSPAIINHQRAFSYDVMIPCLERANIIHHCYTCGENFINNHELKGHKLRNCRSQFTCENCSKSFNQITQYINHVRQHTEDSGENPAPSTVPLSVTSQGPNEQPTCSCYCSLCRDTPVTFRSAQRIHTFDYSSNDED